MGKLIIKVGNIFDYINDVDVIVNSNNQYMISGSGICGSIYKYAGKNELENYCKTNFNRNMITNEIRITPGFELNMDIINIYAPKYHEHLKPLDKLLDSYRLIFERANKNNYKNILTVSIGTGVHGYKHSELAQIIVEEITRLTIKYNINCIMVLPEQEIANMYIKYLEENKTGGFYG